jgi:hypothetical protein
MREDDLEPRWVLPLALGVMTVLYLVLMAIAILLD